MRYLRYNGRDYEKTRIPNFLGQTTTTNAAYSSDPASAIEAANPGYWETYGNPPAAADGGSGSSVGLPDLSAFFNALASGVKSISSAFGNTTGTAAPPLPSSYAAAQQQAAAQPTESAPSQQSAPQPASPQGSTSAAITTWLQANPGLALAGAAFVLLLFRGGGTHR